MASPPHSQQIEELKGVLFDCDGVLIKSMEDHFLGWKAAMKSIGVNLQEEDYYPLEGTPVSAIAKLYCQRFNIDLDEFDKIAKFKEEHYLQHHKLQFYPGVQEIVRQLRDKSVKLAMVTGGELDRIKRTLPAPFLSCFDVILTGEMVERGKPYPDPYLQAARALGLHPKECLVVENAPLGVQSAKSAGMYCIALTNTVDREKLSEADDIVSGIKEIAWSNLFKQNLAK